eukprot:EG_transcript_21053
MNGETAPLPPGWEVKWLPTYNRCVYLNHVDQTTSWDHPALLAPKPSAPTGSGSPQLSASLPGAGGHDAHPVAPTLHGQVDAMEYPPMRASGNQQVFPSGDPNMQQLDQQDQVVGSPSVEKVGITPSGPPAAPRPAPAASSLSPKPPPVSRPAAEAVARLEDAVCLCINEMVGLGILTRERIVATGLVPALAKLPTAVVLAALAEVREYRGSARREELVLLTAQNLANERTEAARTGLSGGPQPTESHGATAPVAPAPPSNAVASSTTATLAAPRPPLPYGARPRVSPFPNPPPTPKPSPPHLQP